MKPFAKFLLGSLLLSGLPFASTGCVSDGSASGSVYYGHHRDPWFHDDPWMDGNRRYYRSEPYRGRTRTDIYISPPRLPSPPRIRLP